MAKEGPTEDGRLIPRKGCEGAGLAVDPALQNLMRLMGLLLSSMKGKTGKYNKLLAKIDLSKNLKKGWQLATKVVLRAFTSMVNKIMDSEELNRIMPLIESYSKPCHNCASLNDLEYLEDDARPGIYLQWQTAQIPQVRFHRQRSYSHLQAQWKNNGHASSRSSSRAQNFSPPCNSSNSLDDADLEDLESERLSQMSDSTSAITAVNVADQNRINNLEQQLAELQKQMAVILQQKRVENLKRENDNEVSSTSTETGRPSIVKNAILAAPVPPPPAPPPPPPGFFKSKTSTSSIKSVASKDVSEVSLDSNSQNTTSNAPSLTLEDLNKAKSGLRKVERSPNGTPMRSSADGASNSQFFKAALANLFHNVKPTETESDNDTESNGAWEEDETEA